jgi:hypothetical protein
MAPKTEDGPATDVTARRRRLFKIRWATWARVLVTVGVLLLALLPHIIKLLLPLPVLTTHWISDDAFYYYKTALNLRHGLGSTFDGINLTNGYHPLWMAVCVVLAFLTDAQVPYLYLVWIVTLLLVGLVSLQLYWMFRPALGQAWALLLILLVNWQWITAIGLFTGLETPLYLVLIFALVEYVTRIDLVQTRHAVLLGILAGLAFLARTDFILLLPVFVLVAAYKLWKTPHWRRQAILAVLPFALLVLPYLAWNIALTGHVQQISGAVKNLEVERSGRTWGTVLATFRDYGSFLESTIVPYISQTWIVWPVRVIMLILVVLSLRQILTSIRGDLRLMLLIACAISELAYYGVAYGSSKLRPWHLILPYIVAQLLFVWCMHVWRDRWKSLGNAMLTVLLTAIVCFAVVATIPSFGFKTQGTLNTGRFYYDEAARWLRENTEPDATIGVWNAGYVGYFSDRRVVNLDGLINGATLYQYLADGRGAWQYAADQRLNYVSDYQYGKPYVPPVSGATIRLVHSIGRADVMLDEQRTYMDWYVWKLDYP